MSLTFFCVFFYLFKPCPPPSTPASHVYIKGSPENPKNFTYNLLYTHDKGLPVSQEAQTKT